MEMQAKNEDDHSCKIRPVCSVSVTVKTELPFDCDHRCNSSQILASGTHLAISIYFYVTAREFYGSLFDCLFSAAAGPFR